MSDAATVIDTSALFAILLGEPEARRCEAALVDGGRLLVSAGTLTEMLVIAAGKDKADALDRLLDLIRPEIVPLTVTRARASAAGYRRWGKSFDPAGLNICDTFAYALAMEHGCPLLFVGDDFARTDVARAV